jgi:hypothetical protein
LQDKNIRLQAYAKGIVGEGHTSNRDIYFGVPTRTQNRRLRNGNIWRLFVPGISLRFPSPYQQAKEQRSNNRIEEQHWILQENLAVYGEKFRPVPTPRE